jgi:phosphate transport system substrate-binding protein
MRMRFALLAAAIGAAVVVAGCGRGRGPAPQGPPPGGVVLLSGAGASFPYPIYSKWFSEYNKENPSVRISYQSIGSGGGIQQLKVRTVGFGASDAPLTDQERAAMPAPVVQIPTVAGAVTVVYNLAGLAQPLRLDGSTLARIYLGEIKQWNDPALAALNPGVSIPKQEIVVVHRSDGSGTTYLFTSYLSAVSPTWRSRAGAAKSVAWPVGIGAKGNEGVAGMVKGTAGTIGYVELAYAKQDNLSIAPLRNAAGTSVTPSPESATAAAASVSSGQAAAAGESIINAAGAGAYPISGFTYILVYKDQPDQRKGEALARFLLWAMDKGQADAAGLGYAPLPAVVVEANRKAIQSLTYQGKPLLPEGTGTAP